MESKICAERKKRPIIVTIKYALYDYTLTLKNPTVSNVYMVD